MSTTREDQELERELAELEREDQHEYYTLLNVDLKATQEEIRSAYRRLCRVYHPDRYGHKCEVPVRYLNPLSFPPHSLSYSLSPSPSFSLMQAPGAAQAAECQRLLPPHPGGLPGAERPSY